MAGKADFTEQEWETLQKGVTGAGLLVSVSDKGFLDTFKEAGALAKYLGEARKKQDNQLVSELSHVRGLGFGLTDSPQEVEKETLAALSSAMATLDAKAPNEKGAYQQLVLDVAESVGKAASGLEAGEAGTIEKLRSALGSAGAAT